MWGDGVRVRPAAVAGRFYPGDPDALAALVDALLADVPLPRRRVRPVAVVAPHASFRFSGPVAATAYAHLAPWRGEVASVVVLGPAHFTPLRGMALTRLVFTPSNIKRGLEVAKDLPLQEIGTRFDEEAKDLAPPAIFWERLGK